MTSPNREQLRQMYEVKGHAFTDHFEGRTIDSNKEGCGANVEGGEKGR